MRDTAVSGCSPNSCATSSAQPRGPCRRTLRITALRMHFVSNRSARCTSDTNRASARTCSRTKGVIAITLLQNASTKQTVRPVRSKARSGCRPVRHELVDLRGRYRARVQVPLRIWAVERPQRGRLLDGLHALGDRVQLKALGEL